MPPPPRRRRIPRPTCASVVLVLAVLAAAGWLTLRALITGIVDHPALPAGLIVVAAAVGYFTAPAAGPKTALRRTIAYRADPLALDPAGFEEYVAELCRRDGCIGVETVGGSGDLGADVIAMTPTGRRMVVQCKRYAPGRRVGSPEVQRVGGTYAVVHGADLAVMVTTAAFTEAAVDYAERAGIRLVDGVELSRWAAERVLPPWGGERMMGA